MRDVFEQQLAAYEVWLARQPLASNLTNLVRRGNDLVLVAEVAGHRRLETTRRYSLPSLDDLARAMEGFQIDY